MNLISAHQSTKQVTSLIRTVSIAKTRATSCEDASAFCKPNGCCHEIHRHTLTCYTSRTGKMLNVLMQICKEN